jgi:PPK2 family polyphosphate:nucleotide phosphotransferase
MKDHPIERHRVAAGAKLSLASIDPRDTSLAPGGKTETLAATAAVRQRLVELQELLWAEDRHRVLVVLQGIDCAGKGGTVKKVFRDVNPAGLRVVSFKKPSEHELAHDYLWRIHPHVPGNGEIAIFDRSHYEDVLIVRVHDQVSRTRWQRRYGHIRSFETMLADEGTTIIKVLLHISKDEQKQRLQARLDDPTKRWKFLLADLDERKRWDDYQEAFEVAVSKTSTKKAPWYVVPADRKWYRDWAVASIVTATLEALDMSWPEPQEDLRDVVIE